MKPFLFQQVTVRFPKRLAPIGLEGIGLVSDLGDDTEAHVFVLPTTRIPQQMLVRVPHKSVAGPDTGWWEGMKPAEQLGVTQGRRRNGDKA